MNGRDLISYSSNPEYFNIIQSQRNKIPKCFESSKKYIFIAGLGRSGTTALGELLNKSSMIAMYTELHNHYRINGYSQSDLSEEGVSKQLKSNPHKDSNRLILAKSKEAKLIGDKRPLFQYCAESSFDNLGIENTKCLFIDRSLIDICKSSQKWSEDPNDPTWPREKGIVYTILLYNASCRQIIHLHDKRPDIFSSFLFPSYENVFFSTEYAIKIFDFCEIELSSNELVKVEAFITQSRKYHIKKADPADPSEEAIRKSISCFLDCKTHERFCTITGNYRDYTI